MAHAADNFAVMLNTNARRVSPGITTRIGEIVDPGDVFISEDERHAESIVDCILDRGYDTVFTGGGDGTVTQLINMLPREEQPRIGILKLGTGNAMAEIVSSGNPIIDLRSYAANPSLDSYTLSLCEAEGKRFSFAGLGMDAEILNDYRRLKASYGDGAMKPLIQNVAGYLVAGFGKTVPRRVSDWMKGKRITVKVTNLGDTAYRIYTEANGGRVGETFGHGETIYEGPANVVGFGTCPFYGYRLKMLPYAGVDPSFFHLRISAVPWPTIASSLPSIWKGTFAHPKMMEFHARNVHIEFSEPMPYQLSGDAMGERQELTVDMCDRGVDLVSFI